jgi:hypothetical protein
MALTSRTEKVYRTLLVYKQYIGLYEHENETALIDILADLMHWANEYGLDFPQALDTAQGHYQFEIGEAS